MLKQFRYILVLLLLLACISASQVFGEPEEKVEKKKDSFKSIEVPFKLSLNVKDGIFRNISPIMVDISFKNESNKPKKLCKYKFYESLVKLDMRDCRDEKVKFSPKLVKAGKIKKKDWATILPGRTFKRSFSLTRKYIDAMGHRIKPGNYKIRVLYEGCSKFDPDLTEEHLESNWLYLMITD